MHSLCATSTGTAKHTGLNKSLISSYVVRGVLGPFKKDGGHLAPTHTPETNHLAPETYILQIRPFVLKLGRCRTPYATRTTQHVERCPQGLTRKRKQTKCILCADFHIGNTITYTISGNMYSPATIYPSPPKQEVKRSTQLKKPVADIRHLLIRYVKV